MFRLSWQKTDSRKLGQLFTGLGGRVNIHTRPSEPTYSFNFFIDSRLILVREAGEPFMG